MQGASAATTSSPPTPTWYWIKKQGVNGVIFALLALDTAGYDVPTDASVASQASREGLIDHLLAAELSGRRLGARAVPPPTSDITAMALQALAPYQDQSEVAAATQRALTVLSAAESADGGFASCVESTSQVIIALTALGIDPAGDPRFTTASGGDPLTALLAYEAGSGGFKHQQTETVADAMASEQAALALVAYDRFAHEKTSLYDMNDLFEAPNAANAAAVAAKAALPASLSCAQAEANAEAAVKAWTLQRLGTPAGGVSLAVEVTDFTAAVVGTAADNDGMHVPFTATVTLTKGQGETLASDTATISGVVTATPYDVAVANAAAVAAAKAALPTSLGCQQKAANTQAAVKTWALQQLGTPANGVSLSVEVTDFSAAVAGTSADADGANGQFTVAVTLSKGDGETRATDTATIVGSITATPYEPSPSSVTVTISVERFTVNDTYVVLPTKVTVPSGTSAAQATTTLLGAGNYRSTGSGTSFYLSGVKVAGYGGDGFLDEFDEGPLSGWKVTVDNAFISTSAGAHTLDEGDVVRWQYTKTGDFPGSRDVGGDAQPADKDALTAKVAEIRDAGTESFYGASFEAALAALATLPATQAEIDAALAELTSHDPARRQRRHHRRQGRGRGRHLRGDPGRGPGRGRRARPGAERRRRLDLGGVGAAVTQVSYAAPVAGSEASPAGTNGAYAFTVAPHQGRRRRAADPRAHARDHGDPLRGAREGRARGCHRRPRPTQWRHAHLDGPPAHSGREERHDRRAGLRRGRRLRGHLRRQQRRRQGHGRAHRLRFRQAQRRAHAQLRHRPQGDHGELAHGRQEAPHGALPRGRGADEAESLPAALPRAGQLRLEGDHRDQRLRRQAHHGGRDAHAPAARQALPGDGAGRQAGRRRLVLVAGRQGEDQRVHQVSG